MKEVSSSVALFDQLSRRLLDSLITQLIDKLGVWSVECQRY